MWDTQNTNSKKEWGKNEGEKDIKDAKVNNQRIKKATEYTTEKKEIKG